MSEQEFSGAITRREALRLGATGAAAVTASGILAACGGSSSSSASSTGAPGSIRRGGTLHIGFVGNGTSETLNPVKTVAEVDVARAENLFDNLVKLNPDNSLRYDLAESFEPNATADVWTVRLRNGVTWHDGSPLVADDLIYTLKQVADPKNGSGNTLTTAFIDIPRMSKMDARTVRLPLVRPNSEFAQFFITFQVIKNGFTNWAHPIGTGPFKFVSWTPGTQSLFKRNPNYWQHGKPYVDELVCISIPDQTARLNALLGGQIDGMEALSFAQAKAQAGSSQIKVLRANGPNIVPIYMATTLDPFRDVRVRQAMRLIADRPTLVASANLGYGGVANDIFGKGLPYYDSALPQRTQDIGQAKSLLKAAGQAGLTITLHSSTVAQGMLESATAFAAQAQQAGVTIHVSNDPAGSYFGPNYLKQNFAQSLWFTESIISHMARSVAPGAPFNETHWNDPQWTSIWNQTLKTTDPTKKTDLVHELQNILWERGGYIEWGTFPLVDGLSSRVQGAVPNSAQPLGNFNFRDWWLSS